VDIALVFANADSGEEFVTVEENVGDRAHLQLWHNTEKLVITHILLKIMLSIAYA
jgi:beta-glucosidase